MGQRDRSCWGCYSDGVDYLLGSHEGEGEKVDGDRMHLTTDGPSISPVKTEAENAPETKVDVLLEAMGGAGAGKFEKGSLDFAEGLNKVSDVVETVNGMEEGSSEGSGTTNTAQTTSSRGESGGVDTISYDTYRNNGFPTTGEYIVKRDSSGNITDTLKRRPGNSNVFFDYGTK